MSEYLFKGKLDNAVHDISIEHIKELQLRNELEKDEGQRITKSSYRGENFYDGKNDMVNFFREIGERDPLTAGRLVQYPHGVVIEQSQRRNYYRGENKEHESSFPSLLRTLNNSSNLYNTREKRELYRLVADMRIAEFTFLLNEFKHVREWVVGDVLYESLAQHYGLETDWLDITSDFNAALFFATCTYEKGKWRPLTKEDTEKDEKSRYGVIFHLPSSQNVANWISQINKFAGTNIKSVENETVGNVPHIKFYDSYDNLVYPIGFQPFMRCSMQNGYGIYMRKSYPLQKDILFQKLRFRHNEELSKRVFEDMRGGEMVYPHEGLNKADFIIDKIRSETSFSEAALDFAVKRSHYYSIDDKEKCIRDLKEFKVRVGNDYKYINILPKSQWRLSSGRKRDIEYIYRDFSIEKDYRINVRVREALAEGGGAAGARMLEPWMLLEHHDSPGAVDFEAREMVGCANLWVMSYTASLHMLMHGKAPDYL